MYTAAGGTGDANQGARLSRGIMEHKVIQNLRVVSGDRPMFRQWLQKFTTALGQANVGCEDCQPLGEGDRLEQ